MAFVGSLDLLVCLYVHGLSLILSKRNLCLPTELNWKKKPNSEMFIQSELKLKFGPGMGTLPHTEGDRHVLIRGEITSPAWASQLELRPQFKFLLCHMLPGTCH